MKKSISSAGKRECTARLTRGGGGVKQTDHRLAQIILTEKHFYSIEKETSNNTGLRSTGEHNAVLRIGTKLVHDTAGPIKILSVIRTMELHAHGVDPVIRELNPSVV